MLRIGSSSLTRMPAMRYSNFSVECWLLYLPVLTMSATTRMYVVILAVIECLANLPPSPSKASTRTFTRIPIRRGSSLLTVVRTRRTCLLVLCLSKPATLTLLLPLTQVPMIQTIGLGKFHFWPAPISYFDCTLLGQYPSMQLATVPNKSLPPSSNNSLLFPMTRPILTGLGSIDDPHSSAATPRRALQSSLF